MDSVLIGKATLALGCSLGAIVLLRSGFLSNLSERSFHRLALAGLILTRVGVFAALYLALGYEVPSDVQVAYLPSARDALQGKLVYRDFFTTYSPLFPYVLAVAVFLWNSGKSIALLAILFEVVGLHYWLKAYRDVLDRKALQAAAVLYVFNPLYISSVAIDGKNDVWIAAALGLAVFLLKNKKDFSAGIAIAWAFAAVKFSVLFPLPALLAYSRRLWVSIASFTAASALVYGLFLINGANVFLPFSFQRSQGQDSSGNLPFLLSAFSINNSSPVYLLAGLTIGCAICFFLWRRRFAGAEPIGQIEMGNWAILILLVALLLSKKSFTYYLVWLAFPLCVWLGLRIQKKLVWLYGSVFFFAIASIEPSLWYRWINLSSLSALPQLLSEGRLQLVQLSIFGLCEVVLIAGYLTLGALIVNDLHSKQNL